MPNQACAVCRLTANRYHAVPIQWYIVDMDADPPQIEAHIHLHRSCVSEYLEQNPTLTLQVGGQV